MSLATPLPLAHILLPLYQLLPFPLILIIALFPIPRDQTSNMRCITIDQSQLPISYREVSPMQQICTNIDQSQSCLMYNLNNRGQSNTLISGKERRRLVYLLLLGIMLHKGRMTFI